MRNKEGLTQTDIANFMTAYAHYCQLRSYFPQLENKNEKLKEFFTEPYYKSRTAGEWLDVELHVVNQCWGSTACGWGGIGGSDMSDKFNFIIKQNVTNLLYVYWDGKLAYIIPESEINDFDKLPSLSTKKAVYTNNNRQ